MNTSSPRMVCWLPLLAMLAVPALIAAEAEKPKAPATLEEQITYLEGSLAEAIQTRDWKMMELAATGFKAAGLTGDKLEIAMLHSERDAALQNYGGGGNVLTWGQAARVKAGD